MYVLSGVPQRVSLEWSSLHKDSVQVPQSHGTVSCCRMYYLGTKYVMVAHVKPCCSLTTAMSLSMTKGLIQRSRYAAPGGLREGREGGGVGGDVAPYII